MMGTLLKGIQDRIFALYCGLAYALLLYFTVSAQVTLHVSKHRRTMLQLILLPALSPFKMLADYEMRVPAKDCGRITTF